MPTNEEVLLDFELRLGEHIRKYNIQDEDAVSKDEEIEIMKKMYVQDMQAKDKQNAELKQELNTTKGYVRVLNKLGININNKVKAIEREHDSIQKDIKRKSFADLVKRMTGFNELTADLRKDMNTHDKYMSKWRKFEEDERKAQQVADTLGEMELA